MARNEDGELELMLGNKQLLSVFFLMVLLLALCFVGGYWLGRSAAPVLTAQNEPSAAVSTPANITEPTPAPEPTSVNPPERTAPQATGKAPEPVKEPPAAPKEVAKEATKAVAKAAPKVEAKAKAAPPPKQAATPRGSGQLVPGRIYLQLSATDKDKADVMVDLLRRKNFAGIAAPVADRPGMFRVLVGPVAENAIADTKAKLKAGGFPADDAIRRVFERAMNLLLSLVTGALLVLVFPRFDLTWLAPIALTPLLIACTREPGWKQRFLHGWAGGFLFWFFVCIWIQFVLEVHGGMGRWGGWGAFVLFALLKALHTGLFAALAGRLMHGGWALLSVAALWCGIEHAHGVWGLAWLGLGFAWLDLGNAGIDWPVLMRLAPITGVHGLSFVLAMTASGVALLALRRPLRELAPLALLPLLMVLPAPAGGTRASESVQVVQPDVESEALWTQESFADFERRLSVLSLDEPAPLIVSA